MFLFFLLIFYWAPHSKKIKNPHTYGVITQRKCGEKLYFGSITFTSTMMNCNWLMSSIQCNERNHCWMNIIRFGCEFLLQFRLQFRGTYIVRIMYNGTYKSCT